MRPWLRALHRDVGYFVVGLTIIYALTGLAVNHIADWDPSFHQIERTHQVARTVPERRPSSGASACSTRSASRKRRARSIAPSDTQLEIVFDKRTLHLDPTSGRVVEEGQEPRLFLRLANWLHLNRGKKAWTYRRRQLRRAPALARDLRAVHDPRAQGPARARRADRGVGAAVPIAYVVLSGGP